MPFDGIEWMNADSEWRDESRVRLARVLFDYLFRPGPAMAEVLDRPTSTLARWDALTARRRVVALAGHDAHGGVGTTAEDGTRRSIGGVPSYDASFRAFTTRVVLDRPLGGDAAADASAVLAAIRAGNVFTTIDALAGPGFLDFRRTDAGAVQVTASTPPGARVVLLHNGEDLDPGSVDWTRASGAYRVEVRLARAPGSPPIPWLVGNPLYFLDAEPPPPTPRPRSYVQADFSWHVEKSMGSDGDLAGSEQEIAIDYRLRAGERASQFVALAGDFRQPRQPGSAVAFEAWASRPMRVSVQLRYPVDGGDARWAHSVYLDRTSRHIVVPLDEMVPVDQQAEGPPPIVRARSLIFVVDLVNALPGSSGTFSVSHVTLAR